MNNSLLRICLVLFASLILIGFTLDDVLADKKEIISQSFSFENTSIIEKQLESGLLILPSIHLNPKVVGHLQ